MSGGFSGSFTTIATSSAVSRASSSSSAMERQSVPFTQMVPVVARKTSEGDQLAGVVGHRVALILGLLLLVGLLQQGLFLDIVAHLNTLPLIDSRPERA